MITLRDNGMITFGFIQRLHALVKKFPERYEEYAMLYPEAFKKVDITKDVEFKFYVHGSSFMTLLLFDGKKEFGEMKPFKEKHLIVQQRQLSDLVKKSEIEEKTIHSMAFALIDGYKVEFSSVGQYGFKLYRYGEKRDVVDLEFDPAAHKDRIKEKS